SYRLATHLSSVAPLPCVLLVLLFTDPASTALRTLSLHDALPISTCLREILNEAHWANWEYCLKQARTPLGKEIVLQKLRQLWSKDRKSTRLNSSHVSISYAVFCLKKKRNRSEWERPLHETVQAQK